MKTQISRLILFITLAAVASLPFSPAPVVAQDPCGAIIGQFQRALDRCSQLNVDWACYAHSVAASSPTDLRFYQPGDRLHVTALDSITTERLDGAVVMRVKPVFYPGEVTLFLFGGADAIPQGGASNVFVMTVENNREICRNTPPGMVIHTKSGAVGRITVNGVQIDLGSTAYVVMENPDTMVIGNVAGQVTVIVPGEAQVVPVGYQTQATGISTGSLALSWPPVPSLYTTSAVAQWLAGLTGLEVVTDSNTEQPDPVPACGGTIALGQTLTAQNAVPGQECIYSFCADAGMAVTAEVKSNTPGYDPYVDLLGSDFRPITFNDNISRLNANSLICNQTLPYTSCDYRLVVRPAQNRSTGQFTLSLFGKTDCTVPDEYCEVVVRGLNLRSGPGLQYTPPLKVLAYGTLFQLLDQTQDATWVRAKVVGSGDEGWVRNSSRYIFCGEIKKPTPTRTTITPITPTNTPTPSDTPTNTPTPIDTPTHTPTPTPTPVKGSPFPGP